MIKDLLIYLGVREDLAKTWGSEYEKAFQTYRIDTPKRISAFFGNIIHECNYFKNLSENLNYSADRLAAIWPNRYSATGKRGGGPNAKAKAIARNPRAIANHCYANRMGNGTEASGDGYRYRGRGPIQVTGKSNYYNLRKRSGIDCIAHPDLLMEPKGGAISSCDYWHVNNLNRFADKDDFDGTADLINLGKKTAKIGDAIGYADRKKVYDKAMSWFKQRPGFKLSVVVPEVMSIPTEVIEEPVAIATSVTEVSEMDFTATVKATSTNEITIIEKEDEEKVLKEVFEM